MWRGKQRIVECGRVGEMGLFGGWSCKVDCRGQKGVCVEGLKGGVAEWIVMGHLSGGGSR